MLIHLPHKEGYGVHVNGNGMKVDVVTTSFGRNGPDGELEAKLSIKGIEGLDRVTVNSNSAVGLIDGISVGIRQKGGNTQLFVGCSDCYNVIGPRYYG